ncbi:hypothetical protein HPT27_10470 [Permianibacter sp. IMCC34836]|uniref:hypothetical protein n=1 Tax=Permianibacter fluminis TaxID=2738515 RepID=UPI0015540153|nr:hypothetical protein [Permianibacter fluminis]NQD37452.1 hypothetical protein [Permianibacter fluminis]
MNVIKCSKCGALSPAEDRKCATCGSACEPLQIEAIPLSPDPGASTSNQERKPLGWGGGLIVLIVTLSFMQCTGMFKARSTDVVFNSPLDGSVLQVEKFLERTLKDPSSFEAISWGAVEKNQNGTFRVRCQYRAKNSFGGFVIETKVFVLDSTGQVINVLTAP